METIITLINEAERFDRRYILVDLEEINVAIDQYIERQNTFEEENKKLNAENLALQKENSELKAERRVLKRRVFELETIVFGQSSEKGNEDDEPNEDAPDDKDKTFKSGEFVAPKKPRGRKGRGKKSFPKELERVEKTILPKSNLCKCGCGGRLVGTDTNERLIYQPAKLYVLVEKYPKYACDNCRNFWQAKVPPRLMPGMYASNELIGGIIVGKFADFLPLYRQSEILKRCSVHIHRSSLMRWSTSAIMEVLKPIWELMLAEIKKSSHLQMDETTAPTLMPGLGKTKMAYALALLRDQRRCAGNEPPCVVFDYASSRAGLHIEEMLNGFDGTLQVDGYAGYNRLMKEERVGGDPILLAYYWSHVRRRFRKLWKSDKSRFAKKIVDEIAKLYAIEAELKGQSPMVRAQVRKKDSEPIMQRIHEMLVEQSLTGLAKDGIGEAVNYTLKLWDGLVLFLNDGWIEIDNNNAENVIRKWVMCRKNALFAGSELGGEAWAIAASIIGTCALLEINPYEYLIWVFEQAATKLPRSEFHTLLPWNLSKK